MLLGQYRQGICPDFIGRIAIGGDSIRADNYFIDSSPAHQKTRHIVRNQRKGYFLFFQLPGGKTCSLQHRPGFIHVDMNFFPLRFCRADYTQRRAVTGGRQRTGVTMRENIIVMCN